MAGNENQKKKLLYIMEILLEKTDKENALTIKNIKDLLLEHDIKAERKSLYKDIELLGQFGEYLEKNTNKKYKIEKYKKDKTFKYHIAERTFELAELKLLVDAVQSSKFITREKSDILIKKIKSLTSRHLAEELQRQVLLFGRVKAVNDKNYENVDKLHKAISKNKQVKFKYFEYTVEKKKQYRKNGYEYTVSPYALSWMNDNYYLIAYYDKHNDGFTHFRVDRMDEIIISDEMRKNIREITGDDKFDTAKYSKHMFCMFSGEVEKVELHVHNSLVNVVIDKFGEDVSTRVIDEEHFKVRVDVAISNTFMAWIFQFGDKVKIVSPDHLIIKMQDMAKKVYNLY